MVKNIFSLQSIGIVRSTHTDPGATPIQPLFAEGCDGVVEVLPEFVPGLEGIERFSHLYLLFAFHRSAGFSLRVKPYLDDAERGVFATRAPRRPNPLGLSIVRLVRREGACLHVTEVDLLDGTPLLDIKPFVPRFDHRPEANSGWLDDFDMEERSERGRLHRGKK
jgi:tRNA (adenine37-N6)-methyltransferase